MFLNLKGKKHVESIVPPQSKQSNHPKTHRDDLRDKPRRDCKEISSYRQHNQRHQQPGSTAVSTLQPSNTSHSNFGPHFKIKIKEHTEHEHQGQEKVDSYRLARVASAYKKIKRVETQEASFVG